MEFAVCSFRREPLTNAQQLSFSLKPVIEIIPVATSISEPEIVRTALDLRAQI